MEKTASLNPPASCPKSMVYGPCGGVGFDGACEVAEHACVFLEVSTVRWEGRAESAAPAADETPGTRMRDILARRQVVVADLPARALDAGSIVRVARILKGSVDAVLAGDSGAERVQYPPAFRAALIRAEGLAVWTGLNCRDRNRVALEGELAGLAAAGAAAVHCVTGDHPQTGGRPDAQPVFDLDSTRLAALARASGHLVSVAESPLAPPVSRRAARLMEKARAGAEVCFVNHAGGAAPVARFIGDVRELGAELAFIPCVPLVIDVASARLLESFTTLVLPSGFIERILRARDPYAEGIALAVALSEELLALDGVRGVNLSGGLGADASDESREHFAMAMAEIGQRLGLA